MADRLILIWLELTDSAKNLFLLEYYGYEKSWVLISEARGFVKNIFHLHTVDMVHSSIICVDSLFKKSFRLQGLNY